LAIGSAATGLDAGRSADCNPREEKKLGLPVKPIDESGLPLIEPLIHVGDERLRDVNSWLEQEQKRGRPGK